jgi:hypothetical protein
MGKMDWTKKEHENCGKWWKWLGRDKGGMRWNFFLTNVERNVEEIGMDGKRK